MTRAVYHTFDDAYMCLSGMKRRNTLSTYLHTSFFFPTQLHLNPPCLECKHAWKPSGIKYNATALKVTHGKTPIRLLGIRYNMWLDSAAQRRYVMDGITEMACFLRKNRDLSIENGLRLIDCTLGPLLAFSGPVIIWPRKNLKSSRQPLFHAIRRPGRCHQIRPRPFSPSRKT